MADRASTFHTDLKGLVRLNPRYHWLLQYLKSSPFFCESTLYQVLHGRTHCLVTDIPTNPEIDVHVSSFSSDRSDGLNDTLLHQGPEGGVRLVFITSISGVGV